MVDVVKSHPLSIIAPEMQVDDEWRHVPDPLPKRAFSGLVVGPPRSGKTSLVHALVAQETPCLYRGTFDFVYLIIPPSSLASLPDGSPWKTHKRVITEFTEETLEELVELLKKSASQKKNTLVVIDDFMSSLKDSSLRKPFEALIANRRHLRCSVMLISQSLRSVPLTVRKLVSHLWIFKVSKKERDLLHEEFFDQLDKSQFHNLINFVWTMVSSSAATDTTAHSFMFLDTDSGTIYRQFDELRVN